MFYPEFIQVPYLLVIDDELQPKDRDLYGVIYWLERLKYGKCFASNEGLAGYANCNVRSVPNSLNRLEKRGYIRRIYKDKQKRQRSEIKCLVRYVRTPIKNLEKHTSNDVSDGRFSTSDDVHIKNINYI